MKKNVFIIYTNDNGILPKAFTNISVVHQAITDMLNGDMGIIDVVNPEDPEDIKHEKLTYNGLRKEIRKNQDLNKFNVATVFDRYGDGICVYECPLTSKLS